MMTFKAAPALFLAALLSGLDLVPASRNVAAIEETAIASGTTRDLLASRIRCIAISGGISKAKLEEGIAKAAADATAYICDGPEDKAKAKSIAEATASVFAIAVTQASVACEGEGNVDFYAKAQANAKAAAEAYLEAYATATAVAGDCKKCEAYAHSFGYVYEYVFLEAIAKSEATLAGYSDASSGSSLIQSTKAFKEVVNSYTVSVEKATATAFAKAIAGAKKYRDGNQCFAWVNSKGCIYVPEDPETDKCFECKAQSVGITKIEAIDAIAEAGAAAIAFTCATKGTHSVAEAIAEVEVAAEEVARAIAKALSFSFASCELDDGSFVCSSASADTKAIAEAVAEAFAESWAEGYTCDDTCKAESEAIVKAVEPVIAKAAAKAISSLCSGTAGKWTVEKLAVSIEKIAKKAIAEAAAVSVSHSTDAEECYAVAVAEAYVG